MMSGRAPQVAAAEQRRLKGPARSLLQFTIAYKGKSLADVDLPETHAARRPRFSRSGPPEDVAQSLLDSKSSRANDNFWPGVATPSRYVLDRDEAREMIDTLAPLYRSRKKAVLEELCRRSNEGGFGCVSPNREAKALLESYGRTLGLDLDFGQPRAPRYET